MPLAVIATLLCVQPPLAERSSTGVAAPFWVSTPHEAAKAGRKNGAALVLTGHGSAFLLAGAAGLVTAYQTDDRPLAAVGGLLLIGAGAGQFIPGVILASKYRPSRIEPFPTHVGVYLEARRRSAGYTLIGYGATLAALTVLDGVLSEPDLDDPVAMTALVVEASVAVMDLVLGTWLVTTPPPPLHPPDDLVDRFRDP